MGHREGVGDNERALRAGEGRGDREMMGGSAKGGVVAEGGDTVLRVRSGRGNRGEGVILQEKGV
jgi:hypothetical protein